MMENLLTLEEISEFVRAIPSDKWQYSQPEHKEQLMFRVADLELVLTNYPLAQIANASLILRYVRAIDDGSKTLAQYERTSEVLKLFQELARRVSVYHNEINAIEVNDALSQLNIKQNLVEKIAGARTYIF